MQCTAHEIGFLKKYEFVVIFTRYNSKWVFCKHKERATWETPGGHIEQGESTLDAAKRELYEESGAVEFDITPICDYCVLMEEGDVLYPSRANGQVFYANVGVIGKLPLSEMEKIQFFEKLPANLTYPDILRVIFPHAIAEMQNKGLF